jgi:dTDP-4-amino-4,6-dideoxygalactose transaminase
MRVPYLDLKRQLESLGEEIKAAFAQVLNDGVYILGPEVGYFESEWASFCGSEGAVGVASGTDALALALKASGAVREGKNDEVITSPLSAGYTALGIQIAGARRCLRTSTLVITRLTLNQLRTPSPPARERSCPCISTVGWQTWTVSG